jgi:hypothetical protein
VRARRLDTNIVELSFLKRKGTTLKTEFNASGGIAVKKNDTGADLIARWLGATKCKSATQSAEVDQRLHTR